MRTSPGLPGTKMKWAINQQKEAVCFTLKRVTFKRTNNKKFRHSLFVVVVFIYMNKSVFVDIGVNVCSISGSIFSKQKHVSDLVEHQ